MDERTSFIEHDLIESRQQTGRLPTTVLFLLLLIMIALAVSIASFRLGRGGYDLPAWLPSWAAQLLQGPGAAPKAAPSGAIIYYRDPDGKPFYSAEPKQSDDGRPYTPVLASEDISFEEQTAASTEAWSRTSQEITPSPASRSSPITLAPLSRSLAAVAAPIPPERPRPFAG